MEVETGEFERLEQVAKAPGLTGKAAAVLKGLKPPPSEDRQVMAWRYFVVTVTVANTITLAGHIVLACGLTPWFAGFAYASDQKTAQIQIAELRVESLEERMFDLRVKQCEAIDKGESPRQYTIRLEDLLRKYWDLKKERPPLPVCAELK